MNNSLKILGILIISLTTSLASFSFARANSATIPINITVTGKLVISNGESDHEDGLSVSTKKANTTLRIRTNLNKWQLVAQRNSQSKNISISFKLKAGSKGNLNAAKLNPIFENSTTLNKIPNNSQTIILNGTGKTSLERDSKNFNNYIELSQILTPTNSKITNTDFENTSITYSLVSI